MKIESREFLPVELVFHPNWWHKHYGMDFGWAYFFDAETRVTAEQQMIRRLHERFGQYQYGSPEPEPEPVIGPVHLAAGFIMSAIWGCEIKYFPAASPQVLCRDLALEELDAMDPPDPQDCREFSALIGLIETLKDQYGYVKGDINWSGLQNLALDLVGSGLFTEYYTRPDLIHRVYRKLSRSIVEVVNYIRNLTGTSSVSVNRSIERVDPGINLHSNCSVQMISNELYESFILPYETEMARRLQPYGVHHCGNNMHNVAEGYSKIPDCCFFDVGWGADVAHCRKLLPDAFFNVRLSPVRMKQCTPDEIRSDIESLFGQVGSLDRVGLCCINMDDGTPDENVAVIFETAGKYRRMGA